MFSFEMKSATIIHGSGPDYIFIKTNLPDACYPYERPLMLQFTCAANGGEAYMKQHFPDIPVTAVHRN